MFKIAICDDEDVLIGELKSNLKRYADETDKHNALLHFDGQTQTLYKSMKEIFLLLHRTGAFYIAFRFPTGLTLAYAGVLTVIPLLISIASMHNFSKEALTARLKGAE